MSAPRRHKPRKPSRTARKSAVVFTCSRCGERFTDGEALMAHAAGHNGSRVDLQRLRRRPNEPPPTAQTAAELRASARARLAFVALFAASFALYAFGRSLELPAVALAGTLGVLFFGIGAAPLQLARRPLLAVRFGVAALVGLSIMTTGGVLMVLAPLGDAWHPFLWAAIVVVAAAALDVAAIGQALRDLAHARAISARVRFASPLGDAARRGGLPMAILIVAGTAAWLGAALAAGHLTPGIGGFLVRIPPVWYAGLATLIVAVGLARGRREVYAALATVSLSLALTVTPALIYAMPRSQSAGKHVQLVQLILTHHHLSAGAGIYAAYSAFFAGIAWVCALARVSDPIGLATWWPAIIGLVGLAELRFLFGRLGRSSTRCWAAIMVVVLVNAIGADYFSPQSVGFVMALGVYGLALAGTEPLAVDARLRASLLCLAGCGLAVTHELSPFIAGGVLLVLTVYGRTRPRWSAAAVLVPAVAWAAVDYHVLAGYLSFSHLLHLSNFVPPKTVAAPGLGRQAIVGLSSHALLLGLLVLVAAAIVGFARHRREPWAWAFMANAGVGLICVTVNPYGNEGIFRAALFGIPWLALVAARAIDHPPNRRLMVAFAGVTLLLLATFLVAEFGMDGSNVVRKSDLTSLRIFESQSPAGSYLLNLGYGDLPGSVPSIPATRHFTDIETLDQTLGTVAIRLPERPTAYDLAALTSSYAQSAGVGDGPAAGDLYVRWSPAQSEYAYEYGLQSLRQSAAWRALLLASPDWSVVYASHGTLLMRLSATAARELVLSRTTAATQVAVATPLADGRP
jgi:hypothetical protein